jgi:TRAP-type mannitol/chloroaromatic compound transport system substrate-binding protein
VESTNWSTASQNDKLGYHKIAPYFTYPGFHSMPVGDFTVNMKEWENFRPRSNRSCRQPAGSGAGRMWRELL